MSIVTLNGTFPLKSLDYVKNNKVVTYSVHVPGEGTVHVVCVCVCVFVCVYVLLSFPLGFSFRYA